MSNYEDLRNEIVEKLGEEKERKYNEMCYSLGEHYAVKYLQENYGNEILERLFLKKASELFKIDIDFMNVVILESGCNSTVQVDYVMYEDKFNKQYQINYNNNQFTIREYNNGMCDWIKTVNV